MTLVASFLAVIQPLSVVMTRPSFDNLVTVITGWIFARRRTVTGALVAAGAVGSKHHSAFHRLFATAHWALDEMGIAVFRTIHPWVKQSLIGLTLDDTFNRKRGVKMFGAGMHHDPLASTRKVKVLGWGLSWVVLCVTVRLPFRADKMFSLPILLRLFLNKNAAKRARRKYKTRPQLAVELLHALCRRFPDLSFHVVADSTYGGESVLGNLPDNCGMDSRLDLRARLYDLPQPRGPRAMGRPRKRGALRPSPRKMLSQRGQRLMLDVYGRRDKVRVVTAIACCHKVPDRLLKIVVVESVTGGREVQAFFSTRIDDDAVTILTRYSGRWSIEETFEAAKTHLGFKQPQGWTRQAVLRTAPMVMLTYGLIVLWFAEAGHASFHIPRRPWYKSKRSASFADMLATLKEVSLRERLSELLPDPQTYEKVMAIVATPALVPT